MTGAGRQGAAGEGRLLRAALLGALGGVSFQLGGDLFRRRPSPPRAYLDAGVAGLVAGAVAEAVAVAVEDEVLEVLLGGLAAGFALALLAAALPPPVPR